MSKHLDNEQLSDAAEALARWFKSQDISPQEAVPVMCKLIVGIVCAQGNPKQGAEAVCRMITATIEAA